MKVVKFGGSSLATAEQVKKICDIVAADKERRVIVVSAPGKRSREDTKVTDLLIKAATKHLADGKGEKELKLVIDRYSEIAAKLKIPKSVIKKIAHDFEERLETAVLDDDSYIDLLKAGGEDNCAKLVAKALHARGIIAHYVCPGDAGMVLSDEAGQARVLKESYGKLRALRDRKDVIVFPGFFGYSKTGKVVTFPRGGSDITGAILAAALDADEYENFTDVDSVLATDPRMVKNPEAIPEITYREMRELAYSGFSVFHDEALEPVFHAGIPVRIKNTNNPKAPGTCIKPTRKVGKRPVIGIAAMKGFCSIYISKYLMNREIGFGRKALQILEDEAISFEHTPTGIDSMSIIIREASFCNATEERVIRRIKTELKADDVSVERKLAMVMVVGEGMRHSIGLAGRACDAFTKAKVNLEMINQGSTELSIMFGVKAKDVSAAVKSLYKAFFKKLK